MYPVPHHFVCSFIVCFLFFVKCNEQVCSASLLETVTHLKLNVRKTISGVVFSMYQGVLIKEVSLFKE